ncbi:PKD domain-containing protein [uncultured Draconibacterium sp.]|uniref:PKD domain-containing protein n=1 Tax=uncultured Draconibacterium sp. TaxID=1573823 RepID=UPI00326170EC
MYKIKPVFLIAFFCIVGRAGFLYAQNNVPVIENHLDEPIEYCEDPVSVAPMVSINNYQAADQNDGMKVSIIQYKKGEDLLVYEQIGSLSYKWNENSGVLEISGAGTADQYQEAVANVYYQNIGQTKTPGERVFSISLLDADYLPFTGHFYQYHDQLAITWTAARAKAASMTYYGLKGYLATIRSQQEQNFIYSKTKGTGWIGGSDRDQEGVWKWVEGPDDDVIFWNGQSGGGPVNGEYSNWRSDEPNNMGDEDYAHILYSVDPGYWNDLPNAGSNSADYTPQGYIVEFGGMAGELEPKLSAVAYVDVRDTKHPKLDYNRVQTLFCGTKTATVDLIFIGDEKPLVELIPFESIVQVADSLTLQPTISVEEYGVYSFLLNTIDDAGCPYADTIFFEFHNQPQAVFDLDSTECYGYNLQLAFTGTIVEETEFTWYYNKQVFQAGVGVDSVLIPLGFEDVERSVALKVNEKGCVDESAMMEVKVKPDILVSAEKPEGCSPLSATFEAATNKPAQSYLWNFDDGSTSNEENPGHTFINSGDELKPFSISLTVLDVNACENTAVYDSMIKVYPVPHADFNFNPQEVLITNPEVYFTNTSHAAMFYFWDFGDSTFSEEKEPTHRYSAMGIYPISLEVSNSFACTDSLVKQVSVAFDKLFPPNAFSPNAALEEDREFRVYADGVSDDGYQLLVFNRWGEVVFESNSQQRGWDGKMKNGNPAPSGVYTWVIEFNDFRGISHSQKGNVTLLY